MNMKITATLLGALTFTALTLQAQTAATAPAPAAAPAPAFTTTVTPSFVSQYMFRGQRLGGGAFEPSVEVDAGNLGVGVWANVPIVNKVSGVSDPEIDPYAYYTFNINDTLSIVPGATLYTYLNAKESNGFYKYTFEPNVAVNVTLGGVKLTPKIYYDMVLKGPTYEVTGGYTIPLKDLGTELDLTAQWGTYLQTSVAKDANPDVKAWGDYWLLGVSAPYQINKDSKISLGYAYTAGQNAYTKSAGTPRMPNTAAVGRSVISLSYSYTF